MSEHSFAGALLKLLRLEKNWSQETLCQGICTVSYLSKIEQRKVSPNTALLQDLFGRLGIEWQAVPKEEDSQICEELYERIFAEEHIKEFSAGESLPHRNTQIIGPNYLDNLVIEAYCTHDPSRIPEQMKPMLDSRQRCLLYLTEGKAEQAFQIYPCALAAQNWGECAYRKGDYTLALEVLQQAYDMACQNGYVIIMMYCQVFIANCYSDLRNVASMLSHYKITRRLARAINHTELLQTIDYNIASTRIECGEYEKGYGYFSKLASPSVMDLHKLAVCCEKLGKEQEAVAALAQAEPLAVGIEADICALVRYRLTHPDYLKDSAYGKMLLSVFNYLRKEMSAGYALFHLPWVEEWCAANRQYRMIYEILKDFPDRGGLTAG